MRVTVHDEPEGGPVTLKIEGKLAGAQVPELHRVWRELSVSLGARRVLVDLRGLMHVDEAGRNLLANMHATRRIEFLADTPLTQYFAEQARQKDSRR